MYKDNRVVVVLPAFNAEHTLKSTVEEIPSDWVDEIVLCDDASADNTVLLAKDMGIQHIIHHDSNLGYGANQKSLFDKALSLDADIIVLLHPDYQYTPKLIVPMIHLIADGIYPVVLGSRILGKGALKGGMPLYKYVANRFLTFIQNLLIGYKLAEYHTGYRAFSADVLRHIDYAGNSDDFVFDNEILSQIIYAGYDIGEITCPTSYFEEASSISFTRAVKYGIGVLKVSLKHFLQRAGLAQFSMYRHPTHQ